VLGTPPTRPKIPRSEPCQAWCSDRRGLLGRSARRARPVTSGRARAAAPARQPRDPGRPQSPGRHAQPASLNRGADASSSDLSLADCHDLASGRARRRNGIPASAPTVLRAGQPASCCPRAVRRGQQRPTTARQGAGHPQVSVHHLAGVGRFPSSRPRIRGLRPGRQAAACPDRRS
jgi:hypothetical protein